MKVVATLVFALLSFASIAASSTFDFKFKFPPSGSGGFGDSGSGSLIATYDAVNNNYIVTGVTGTTSAFGLIIGLDPVNFFAENDNLLYYPDTPYLDQNGISFKVIGSGDDGYSNVNLFYFGPGLSDYTEASQEVGTGPFVVISPTPEPAYSVPFLLLVGFVVFLSRCVRTPGPAYRSVDRAVLYKATGDVLGTLPEPREVVRARIDCFTHITADCKRQLRLATAREAPVSSARAT